MPLLIVRYTEGVIAWHEGGRAEAVECIIFGSFMALF